MRGILRKYPILRSGKFWGMVFAAEMCLTRGAVYTFNIYREPPVGLSALGPFWLQVYGLLWIAAALGCLVLGIWQRKWSWLITAVAAPAMAWCLSYLIVFISTHNASWTGALYFQAISGMIFWLAATPPIGGWHVATPRRRERHGNSSP